VTSHSFLTRRRGLPPACLPARLPACLPACLQVDAAAATFERWFTWCQCCHHGGHSGCLRSWFELHTVCPVSGCKCICLSKDVS
jgi:hypothetical protein